MSAMIFTALLSLIGAAACGLLIFVSNRLKMSSRTTEALLFGALVLPFLAAVGYFALRPVLPAVPISTPIIPSTEQVSPPVQEQSPIQESMPEYEINWEPTIGGEYIPDDFYIPPEYDLEITWHNTAPAVILPSEPKPTTPTAPAATVEPVAPSEPSTADTASAVSLDPRMIMWIWLAVAAFALIKLRVDYSKTMRALKISRTYVYDFEGVPVYSLDTVAAPMLAGIIKPAIYIPTESTADLTLALRHELMHLKRLDIPKKLILEMIGSFTWFNPLWHLAKRATIKRAELACDEQMLLGEDYAARRQYAETVMSFAGSVPRKGLAAQLSAGGETLKTRVENIMDDKPAKKRPFIVIAVIVAILLITAIVCLIILPPEGKNNDDLDDLFYEIFNDPVSSGQDVKLYTYEITGSEKTGVDEKEMRNILDKLFSKHFTAYYDGEETAIKDANLKYDGSGTIDVTPLELAGEYGTFFVKRIDHYSYQLCDETETALCILEFETDSPCPVAQMILHDEETPTPNGNAASNSTVGNTQDLVNEVSAEPRPSYVTNFDGTKPLYSGLEFNYSEYMNYTRYFDEYINECDITFDPAIYDHVVGPDYFLLRGRTYLYQIYGVSTSDRNQMWDVKRCLKNLLSEFDVYLGGEIIDLSFQNLEINGAPATLVSEHGEFTLQRTGSGVFVINDEHGYLYTIGISPYANSVINSGYGIYRVSKRESVNDPNEEMRNTLVGILENYPGIQSLVSDCFDKFEIGSSFSYDSNQGLLTIIRDGWNLFTLKITDNDGSVSYHYAIIPYTVSSSIAAETNKPGGNYKVLQYSFYTGDPDGEIRTSLNKLFGEYDCRLGTEEFSLAKTDFPIGEKLTLKGENGTCTLIRNSYYTYTFTDESGENYYYTIMPATWTSKDKGADQGDLIRATAMSWHTNAFEKAAAITNEWITGYLDDGTPVYDYPDWWGEWYLRSADMHIRVTELSPEIEEYISSRIDMSFVELELGYCSMNEAIRCYNETVSLCQERMTEPDSLYNRIYSIEFDHRNLGTYLEAYIYPDEDVSEMNEKLQGLAKDLRDEIYASIIMHACTYDEENLSSSTSSFLFIATHIN